MVVVLLGCPVSWVLGLVLVVHWAWPATAPGAAVHGVCPRCCSLVSFMGVQAIATVVALCYLVPMHPAVDLSIPRGFGAYLHPTILCLLWGWCWISSSRCLGWGWRSCLIGWAATERCNCCHQIGNGLSLLLVGVDERFDHCVAWDGSIGKIVE